MNIGFVGLGRMGRPMTLNLLKAGHVVTVHNRSRAVVDELAKAGARPATSPAEVARDSEIVLTCLSNTPSIEDVYFGANGLIEAVRPGQILVDHSTASPTTSKQCAEAARAGGADFLDAPVSGGPAGAQAATLTIMVGGEKATFERALPVFQAMGKNIRLVGPTGAGSTIKLANQLLVAINVAGVVEAMVMGTKAGADPHVMLDVLGTSFGGSAMLTRCVPMMLDRNFAAGTTINLLLKDLGLIDELSGGLKVRTLMGSTATQIFRESSALGLGDDDMAGLVRALERLANVEVR
ncbi:MAG TPA: NAD(P)-dependent oxidoreductase [Chloroflexota bacterium]|nr:NAD(P)-dependent oxidoreductase [Chloroflexota bacterium]